MKQEIKQLSQIEHVLHRPSMYIGSINLEIQEEFLLKDDKFVPGTREYIPGMMKLFNEVIDNSIDEYVRTKGESANKVSVKVTDTYFECFDNGRGIPNTKMKTLKGESKYQAEVAFTEMLSGANYDNEDEATIGTNGLGSKAASIFSKKSIIINADGKEKITITTKNNMSDITVKSEKSSESGVHFKIYPDFEYFGIEKISDTDINVIKERLLHLSIAYPDITFKFNGKVIRLNTKKYFEMFNAEEFVNINENVSIAISHSPSDQFEDFSLVNGLVTKNGGTHINMISRVIVDPIRNKLVKKFKTIKPGDVKQKLRLVVIFRNFKNARYTSQTKEEITNSQAEIVSYMGDYNTSMNKFISKVLRNENIMLPITELFLLKEEAKRNAELKKSDKKSNKKPESEKFMPPVGNWDRVFICEGDSAANSISKLIGRNNQGFYAMFGVPPNAYSSSMDNILKSDKLKDLKDIIGLQYGRTTQNQINFREIIITTDFDLPGHFIAGQLIGLLYRFGKNLFDEKRVKRLVTPLLVATDNKEKIVSWFYNFEDYQKFEKDNKSKNYNYDYKKGLGSWDSEELDTVIAKDGLENMLEVYELDDNAGQSIDSWLGNDAQKRKDLLNGVEFDMMSV